MADFFKNSEKSNRVKQDMLALVDVPLFFTRGKRPENGEDSASYICHRDGAFFGVFDGCGGAGAQKCPKFHNKTEAYIAARLASDVFESWFDQHPVPDERSPETLKAELKNYFSSCHEQVGEKNSLMGSLQKSFPTTAAAGVCTLGDGGITLDIYWAGDSRVYLLDEDGLAQLTEDDLGGINAMDNLTMDGALTNLISLSRNFIIHTKRLTLKRPALVFAATDGCFGYLSTPMEFEYYLLSTLLEADNISHTDGSGWLERLQMKIDEVSGDDFSLSGYALGFGSPVNMREALFPRAKLLYERYILGLESKTQEDKHVLWQDYRVNYERLLCHG